MFIEVTAVKGLVFGVQVSARYLSPLQSAVEQCKSIENLGFGSIFFGDHLAYPDRKLQAPNTWVMLGALAKETTRVKLGVGVTDPHRYHPVLLAQLSSTCDVLSNGRFILGLGAGEAMNLDPYGISWNRPIARLKEAILIIRKLWLNDRVSFSGEFYNLKEASLSLKPITRPHPPIWLAAMSKKSIELLASEADGWYPMLHSPDSYSVLSQTIRSLTQANGRKDTIERGLLLYANLADDDATSRREIEPFLQKEVSKQTSEISSFTDATKGIVVTVDSLKDRILFGAPDTAALKLKQYVSAGVQHIVFRPIGPETSRQRTIKLLGEKVLPTFS